MKNIFTLTIILLNCVLFAQPAVEPTGIKLTPAVEPSSMILSKFSSDYPNTRAIWTKEEDNIFSAMFRDANTNLIKIIRYDINGNVLSRENELENNTYPVSISKFIVKKYPGEMHCVWSLETEGTKTYYFKHEEEIFWFNTSGKYLKTTRQTTSQ